MASIENSLQEDNLQYSCLMAALAEEVEDAQVQSANIEGKCSLGGEATAVEDKIAEATSQKPPVDLKVLCKSTEDAYVAKIRQLQDHLNNSKGLSNSMAEALA